QGVRGETLVGVSLERSLELIVALLGILKAGGAYLPLDPSYPQERLLWMLQDARPLVLLTQSHLRDRLPISQAPTLCLDSERNILSQQPTTGPQLPISSQQLAYV